MKYAEKRNTCYVKYIVLLAFVLGFANTAIAQSKQPIDTVSSTVSNIINLMTDDKYASNGMHKVRRQKILEQVDNRFNFKLMSKLALGNVWKKRTAEEQQKFVDLFTGLLKNTYIRRIESYSDEKVVFTKQVVKKNLAKVYSLFLMNNSEISIIYKLKQEGNDWFVYDVVIEGASVIKQYRRQFAQIMKQDKFKGLVIKLEEKVKIVSRS